MTAAGAVFYMYLLLFRKEENGLILQRIALARGSIVADYASSITTLNGSSHPKGN